MLHLVDPVAVCRTWLLADIAVTDLLGGPEQVGTENEPPYPCIVLTDPPGDDRTLRHLIAPLVQVEVMGDIDGRHGKPELRAILYRALARLAALPDQAYGPTDAVVTNVESSGGGGWVPLPTGQPRYLSTIRLYMHPPREVPA